MHAIDLPLTIRHDLDRLGLDNTSVLDADGGGCTLRFTHDQLTDFAERLGSDAIATADQLERLENRIEHLVAELAQERLNCDAATGRAEAAEGKVEQLTKSQGCQLGHCKAAGLS